MMRSLYSGVSGLKVHQTKMDVIGHNISNVNTIGFKSGQVNFSDILYQTTANASGPNAEANTAGTNARQIGLGASVASISNTVTVSGGTQRTDNALDLMIEGDQLFIVNNGVQNYFTKAGAFTVDAAGVLCNSGGCKVMGWQVDPNDPTRCVQDTVSELRVRSAETSFVEPEATTNVYFSGNIDYKDTQLQTETGKTSTISFYDKLGQSYMAVVNMIKPDGAADGDFTVSISDILDSSGQSIFVKKVVDANNTESYVASDIPSVTFGDSTFTASNIDPETGKFDMTGTGLALKFNASNGKFIQIGNTQNAKSVSMTINGGEAFTEIDCDFHTMTMYASSGSSSFSCQRGDVEKGTGAGKPKGNMTGISVDTSGRIYGSYDNGDKKLLCQIAVARFANPAGLEAVGNSLFLDTMNSEKFDGRGEDIAMHGGKMTSGVLEMSNVDLSNEFTSIITTQRGFQANSRVITTSDTMLEELINLKR
jgi:flagellar hook protein FlgE